MKDQEPRQLTPAEQFFKRCETPLTQIDQLTQLNNDAVKLFAEGDLNISQLINVSVRLALRADHMADKVLKADITEAKKPDEKPLIHATLLSVAQENRTRAITLTLERQKSNHNPKKT